MQMLLRFTLLSALILPAAACKGPTGLKADKKLNELSDDEKKSACENLVDYTDKKISEDDVKAAACITVAIFDVTFGGTEESCNSAYDQCLQEATSEPGETSCEIEGDITCTATVEEYEACFDERIDATLELIKSFSCAELVMPSSEPPAEETDSLCSALAQKCPGLFSSGSEQ
ncbi:MAG TPA: hypothetical protein ENJ18_02620 [Nannocystis exedens]|nr:hypothetical protein [Nannocystis exedens]